MSTGDAETARFLDAARRAARETPDGFDVAHVLPALIAQSEDARLRVGVVALRPSHREVLASELRACMEAAGTPDAIEITRHDPAEGAPVGVDVWIAATSAIEPLQTRDKEWLADMPDTLLHEHVLGVVMDLDVRDTSRRAYLFETTRNELMKRGLRDEDIMPGGPDADVRARRLDRQVVRWLERRRALRERALAEAAASLATQAGRLLQPTRQRLDGLVHPETIDAELRELERAGYLIVHTLRDDTSAFAERLDAALDLQWHTWLDHADLAETEAQRVHVFIRFLRGWMEFDLIRVARDEAGRIVSALTGEHPTLAAPLRRTREFAAWSSLRPELASDVSFAPETFPDGPSPARRILRTVAPVAGTALGFWKRGRRGALLAAPASVLLSRMAAGGAAPYEGPPLHGLLPVLREDVRAQLVDIAREVIELLVARWHTEQTEQATALRRRRDAADEQLDVRARLTSQIDALTDLIDAAATLEARAHTTPAA